MVGFAAAASCSTLFLPYHRMVLLLLRYIVTVDICRMNLLLPVARFFGIVIVIKSSGNYMYHLL
jgi:hypothetical protein